MNKKQILCSVYRSNKRAEMYLYVKKDTDLTSLPEVLYQQFGEASLVMSMLLSESRKLARADVGKVLAMIEEQGFYLQLPPAAGEIVGWLPGREDA